jgi:hypothetical protein
MAGCTSRRFWVLDPGDGPAHAESNRARLVSTRLVSSVTVTAATTSAPGCRPPQRGGVRAVARDHDLGRQAAAPRALPGLWPRLPPPVFSVRSRTDRCVATLPPPTLPRHMFSLFSAAQHGRSLSAESPGPPGAQRRPRAGWFRRGQKRAPFGRRPPPAPRRERPNVDLFSARSGGPDAHDSTSPPPSWSRPPPRIGQQVDEAVHGPGKGAATCISEPT